METMEMKRELKVKLWWRLREKRAMDEMLDVFTAALGESKAKKYTKNLWYKQITCLENFMVLLEKLSDEELLQHFRGSGIGKVAISDFRKVEDYIIDNVLNTK